MIYDKLRILINNINHKLKNNTEIIAMLIFLVYILFTKDYKIYIFLNSILTIAMMTVFIYANTIRKNFVNKTFIKVNSLNIISITSAILNLIVIKIVFTNQSIYYLAILYGIQANLEYLQIDNIFKVRNNKLNNILIYLNSIIVIILGSFILRLNNILNVNNKNIFFYLLILINILIGFYVGIKNISSFFSNVKKLHKLDFKKISIYTSSIISNYIILITFLMGINEVTIIIMMIKSFIFYDFYNYIICKILDNSLKEINKNINSTNTRQKDLNSILIKRNTVLKETNIMIQKSQDKYNELIESIYGAVFLFSFNKLKYVNNGTLKFVNNNENEILGMDLDDFIFQYFEKSLEEIKQLKNYAPSVKMKCNNLDVEFFLTEVNSETKIIYIHDVTEKNNNTRIIEEMEQYLKEDELKKEFFSNISHELKTPINLIYSAIQVNEIYLKENNIDGFIKNKIRIKQNCNRLIRTINNFIDANKVSEGYTIPNYKIHNIVEIVENTSMASNKYIKLIDNTLTFDAEEEEIYVNCDKEMITRIILNILSNSVKYGRKNGSIQVNISIEGNDNVYIRIKNDGLKIDERTIPYIFDRFTKLNKAFNRIREGSGLGMFLSKALVELQGGNIKLITNNKGNEFIINMPIVKDVKERHIPKELEINALEEKVDVEFSDIYIE